MSADHPWSLTVWPLNLEIVFMTALETHSYCIDSPKADGLRPYIERLRKNDVRIDEAAMRILLMGWSMKNPMLQIAATDTAIIAVTENRLAEKEAVDAMSGMQSLDGFVISRWIRPLKIIAEQSALHTGAVCRILEGFIPAMDGKRTGDFLEILYESSVSLGRSIQDKDCRNHLKTITGTGKAAKLAKKLLQL